jgi:cytochrome P450
MSWILEGTSPMRRRDTVAQQIEVCFSHLHKHVAELVAEADDGFIGRAFHALPPDEDDPAGAVAAIACVILIMGNDAVGSCLTNGVQKLKTEDSHPVAQSDWESIADDAMRYVAPIDFMNRIAARDTIIAGCPVAKGERVLVSPLCANHDTAEFGDLTASITVKPDKNIGLTFGAGSHVCVGNRFSRTVIRLAFAGLAELPELSIAGEAVRGAGKVVRTVVSLPVQFQ